MEQIGSLLQLARQDDQASAGHQGEKEVEDGGVEGERGRGKDLVTARGTELAVDVPYVGEDGGGADKDAFGLAGRAGGGDDVGQVVSGAALSVPGHVSAARGRGFIQL